MAMYLSDKTVVMCMSLAARAFADHVRRSVASSGMGQAGKSHPLVT
jgi:hypothetical protein